MGQPHLRLGTKDAAEKQPAGAAAGQHEAGGCGGGGGVTTASGLLAGTEIPLTGCAGDLLRSRMPQESAGERHEHSMIQMLYCRAKSPKRRPRSSHGHNTGITWGLEFRNYTCAHT